jgi:Ni/Fe-hydrogenase subunit HybB-like protein
MSRVRSYIWTAIFGLLMLAGGYAVFLRFVYGLGAATNLSDQFPWGLWVGFDVLTGVGLAAGGFTLVATVHIFNIETYKPMLRPAILTALLGYLLVVAALLIDLGRPWYIWHPMVMWNHHSVMFEVAWCVTLYTTVLSLEFSPAIFEYLGWHVPLKAIHAISVPLMIAGVLLSVLHQSSLGTVYLIAPERLHPLWYSPMLPLFFFLSSVAVGLAMTIFESWHSSRAFSRRLELPLLQGMGRLLAVILSFYIVLRFADLATRGSLRYVFEGSLESWLFVVEVLLMLLPALLLFQTRIHENPSSLYGCAVLAVFGFVTNRLNVSITGVERTSGTHYIPRWTEVAVTLAIIAFGFAVFRLAVKKLPIFAEA